MAARRPPGRKTARQEQIAEAKAAEKAAARAVYAHARNCYRCSKAISMTGDYCDTGWPLAKARARAIYYVYKVEQGLVPASGQLPLF